MYARYQIALVAELALALAKEVDITCDFTESIGVEACFLKVADTE